ncbi:hypothetical protein [Nonomuraea guangzhouensis]|uniref:Uncharacterized protein n=1 Tax=Nonomuraea guangzhouensis TaxID=1291555 RepID=A0ABW4G9E6_9ACTN|nr:hypothetical protein [Nonomuraea guangzhouensis]
MPDQQGDGPLPSGVIQLYDNYLPSLEPGSYDVAVTCGMTGVDTGDYFQPVTQGFEVRAPQFFLDARDVGEMYPPSDSNGEYGSVLPSLVLNQRVLPWERLAGDGQPKTVPWLALLTLGPDDVVMDSGAGPTGLRTSTVAQFLTPEDGVVKPAIDPPGVDPDVLAATMQSILLPTATFQALAPRLDELRYLTHVRQTDTAAQADSNGADDGWYAIVWSNRFPDSSLVNGAGTRNLACLVSLEGLTSYLPSAPSQEQEQQPAGIQLAVLTSWTFVSNPAAAENFADLVEGFVTQESGDPDNLLPRIPLPDNPPASAALDRLRQGYLPLTFHTPVGEQTFAWYRGPFTPTVAQPLPNPSRSGTADDGAHWRSSSQVTIYLPDQGVFDHSYAAAFETGRSIALSDRAFALALLNARRHAYTQLARIGDRLSTGRFDAAPLSELTDRHTHRRQFAAHVNAGLGDDLRQTFARLPGGTTTPRTPRPDRRRPDPVEETRALLGRDDVREMLAQQVSDRLDQVTDWLAELALLHNVPFNHLVPDARLLPVESIRFFHIDQSWIDVLLDGALSIAVHSSRDAALQAAWRAPLLAAVQAKTGQVRARRRRRPDLAVPTAGDPAPASAGLLIRSALIAGWPGLVVDADDGATAILRMDILSPDVLLVLFDAVPQTVSLSEPWHGLRFGVEDGDVIQLRKPDGTPLGQTFPATGGFSQYLRAPEGQPAERVIDLDQLVTALGQTPVGDSIGPALLATQMVQAPERLTFAPATTLGGADQ